MEVFAEQKDWRRAGIAAQEILLKFPSNAHAAAYVARARSEKMTAESYLSLSHEQFQAGKYHECSESAEQALQLRADFPEAYNNIAAADAALGRWDDAINGATEAVRLKPDFVLAQNTLNWSDHQKIQASQQIP